MKVPVFDEVRRYVAGVDLAGAANHYVCGPRNDDGSHDVEHFGTTTPELKRMLSWLKARGVESVAMESTWVYWIPVWDVLEAGGIEVRLVDNPRGAHGARQEERHKGLPVAAAAAQLLQPARRDAAPPCRAGGRRTSVSRAARRRTSE